MASNNKAFVRDVKKFLKRNSMILVALFILVVALSIFTNTFLTKDNLLSVVRQCSVEAVLAFGMALVLIIGCIDLSVSSVVALSGCICVYLIEISGFPTEVAVLLTLLFGAFCGLANGLIAAFTTIPAFIITLATQQVFRGAAYLMTNGKSIMCYDEKFGAIGTGNIGPIPILGRSMIDSMHYLLKCYEHEKERGVEHPNWMVAIEKFCDKFIEIQNPNGSWNRGYSMKGEPLTNPPQWFGATEIEQGSGAIFPVELMVEMYKYTMDKKYLRSAEKAARFVRDSYVDDVEYIGGLNDTTHRKSVKIDAVGVMFAMRTMLLVYEANGDKTMLEGAYSAAKILASWVYLWDIPFDKTTLLGKHGFNTTGWANCDVIPAGSYVDCEFVEFIPEYLRIAEYCQDKELAIVARIVTRGMQHGLSMPQNMYGYAMPGVQCEGYMTSLWLADTEYKGFSGAAAKNRGLVLFDVCRGRYLL